MKTHTEARPAGRRARSRFALAGLVSLALLAAAPAAYAQARPDKASNEQHAKDLFATGDAAYAEGRYEEALAAFREAHALSNRPQLLFNVSNALERLGRYPEALEALEKYLASGKAKDRDVVQKRLVNLKKRVEEQKKDQERLAKEEAERKAKEAEERKAADAEAARRTPPEPVTLARPERPAPVVPIVLVGTGAAALVAGGVFGLLTLSARSDAAAGCTSGPAGNLCGEGARSAIDREKTFGLVTDISLASGIVLGAVGLYLLLTRGSEASVHAAAKASRLEGLERAPVRVVGRPGGGGVELVGTF